VATTTKNLDLYRRGQLPALPESQVKYLQDELAKLEKQSASQYDHFQLIQQDITGNSAAIDQERTVRANETASLAQQIQSITATGARVSTFVSSTAPSSSVEGDLWINTGDNNRLYRYKAGTGWVEISDARISNTQAALTSEQTARQNADTALGTRIDTVTATATRQRITRGSTAPSSPAIGDLWIDTGHNNIPMYWNGTSWQQSDDLRTAQNTSAISTEQTARADGDTALGHRIDSVESNTNTAIANLNARVDTEVSTRSTADSSMATQLNTVSATASKVRVFRQSATPTANFTGDIWFNTGNGNAASVWDGSTWQPTDDTRIAGNQAAISSEQSARINADGALSTRIDNLTATVNGNSSSISSEQTARASADTALGQRIDSVSSTVGSHTTTISSLQSSVNGITGRIGVTIDNNGYVSGWSLLSDTSNGNPSSVFRISAANFAIRTPGAASDSIYWDGSSLVVRGNVLATSVQGGAVSNNLASSQDDTYYTMANTAVSSYSATTTFGTLACSGGQLLVNGAIHVACHVINTACTTMMFRVQPLVNGSAYGLLKTFILPTVAWNDVIGAGRRAEFTLPLIFNAGARSGSTPISYQITAMFYGSTGAAVNANGTNGQTSYLLCSHTGYLQEMKA
jgi:hypothetical protein